MPLSFDACGLLEPGVHDATLDEIQLALGGEGLNVRRKKLLRDLQAYRTELQELPWGWQMILDGSFVMSLIADPHDIDLILLLDDDWGVEMDLSKRDKNLLSRNSVAARYDIDVFPAVIGSFDERMWTVYFGQVNLKWCQQFGWPPTTQKGLVRVT